MKQKLSEGREFRSKVEGVGACLNCGLQSSNMSE